MGDPGWHKGRNRQGVQRTGAGEVTSPQKLDDME